MHALSCFVSTDRRKPSEQIYSASIRQGAPRFIYRFILMTVHGYKQIGLWHSLIFVVFFCGLIKILIAAVGICYGRLGGSAPDGESSCNLLVSCA